MRKKFSIDINIETSVYNYIEAISTGERMEFPFPIGPNDAPDDLTLEMRVLKSNGASRRARTDAHRVYKLAILIKSKSGDVIERRHFGRSTWIGNSDIVTYINDMVSSYKWEYGIDGSARVMAKIRSLRRADMVTIYSNASGMLDKRSRVIKKMTDTSKELDRMMARSNLDDTLSETELDNIAEVYATLTAIVKRHENTMLETEGV